jgi:hypothetical protein
METTIHQITDHEILGGILSTVIALAEKLTGERLTVYLHTEVGEVPICGGRMSWSKDSQAAEVRYDPPVEQLSKLAEAR